MLISLFAGYYAVGAEVTLAIISSSAVVDLGVFDLSYRTQRIENILRMIMGHATTQNLFRSFGETLFNLHALHLTPWITNYSDTGTWLVLHHQDLQCRRAIAYLTSAGHL